MSTRLCDGESVHVAGIMQHIEEAGVHSGDSACSLPPYSLSDAMIDRIKEQTVALARALNVVGLMNVQFAIKGDDIYLIEVNPRASRTVPFVAKATDSAIASIAARLMAGEKLSAFPMRDPYPEDADYETDVPMADMIDARRSENPLVLGQGGGAALRPLPRRGHDPRAGDAVHRRGHGLGPQLPPGLPQGADGGGHASADRGHGVPVGQE